MLLITVIQELTSDLFFILLILQCIYVSLGAPAGYCGKDWCVQVYFKWQYRWVAFLNVFLNAFCLLPNDLMLLILHQWLQYCCFHEWGDRCSFFGKNAAREIGGIYYNFALFHLVWITVDTIAQKTWVIEIQLTFKAFGVFF